MSITVKKGSKITVPVNFKKKVVINNTINVEKLKELSNLVKRYEKIDVINQTNN